MNDSEYLVYVSAMNFKTDEQGYDAVYSVLPAVCDV